MALDLARLGKVAGIGGITIGAVVLIVRPLIDGALPTLEPSARAQAVFTIAIGAFVLGIVGIIAWFIGGRSNGRGLDQFITAGRDAAVGGRDAFVNSQVTRSSETGRNGATGYEQKQGRQQVKASRDAAVGGRDAAANSTTGSPSGTEGGVRR
jgi:hypothetical protein